MKEVVLEEVLTSSFKVTRSLKISKGCPSSNYSPDISSPAPYKDTTGKVHPFDRYEIESLIGSGTYGDVFKSRDKSTNEIVALKRLKYLSCFKEMEQGFPKLMLREIRAMKLLHSEHLLPLEAIVEGEHSKLALRLPLCECSLYDRLYENNETFSPQSISSIIKQLMKAMHDLHMHGFVHRDIKPSNCLFLKNKLLLSDFGSTRPVGIIEGSPNVQTLSYRAPELLLGGIEHAPSMDLWSAGCILYELLVGKPAFPGTGELIVLGMMFDKMGVPSSHEWPELVKLSGAAHFHFSDAPSPPKLANFLNGLPLPSKGWTLELWYQAVDLLCHLMVYNPHRRLTALSALTHPFLSN